MFITRATRRDSDEIRTFYESHEWMGVDPGEGVSFIARQGPIVGCVRVIDLSQNRLLLTDVVVAPDHRGSGVGEQLVRAAMNARGGTIYAPCGDDTVGFYERLGFSEVPFDSLPADVRQRLKARGDEPDVPGALTHYMKAR